MNHYRIALLTATRATTSRQAPNARTTAPLRMLTMAEVLREDINPLDYLQELGVTAMRLTPTLANDPKATDYHGFGTNDMCSVDPRLGTLAEYRELSDHFTVDI